MFTSTFSAAVAQRLLLSGRLLIAAKLRTGTVPEVHRASKRELRLRVRSSWGYDVINIFGNVYIYIYT